MCKVNNKNTRMTSASFISHLFSSVSIVNFEHVNAGWATTVNHCVILVLTKNISVSSQQTFTCSKSTMKILEKGVIYVQS